MSRFWRYGAVALGVLVLVTGGLWPWLSPPARLGVLVAAMVAYPVQLLAFFAMLRYWDDPKRFMVAWMGGALMRLGVILFMGLVLLRVERLPPVPTLPALAGFLFALLLLEPLFIRRREAGGSGGS